MSLFLIPAQNRRFRGIGIVRTDRAELASILAVGIFHTRRAVVSKGPGINY
jgi:hypothetical protein